MKKKIDFKKIFRLIFKLFIIGVCAGVLCLIVAVSSYFYVGKSGEKYLTTIEKAPQADAIIILGAFVFKDGTPSQMLGDRLEYGYKLYIEKKAPKIIVSGDNGRTTYNEVGNMRKYLLNKGVPSEDIFMDHAGFDTYDSAYRAKAIFGVKKAVFVSQDFHVVRAVYTARKLGIEAYGVASSPVEYGGIMYNRLRELLSRTKSVLYCEILKPKPKYLGEAISLNGSGEVTAD